MRPLPGKQDREDLMVCMQAVRTSLTPRIQELRARRDDKAFSARTEAASPSPECAPRGMPWEAAWSALGLRTGLQLTDEAANTAYRLSKRSTDMDQSVAGLIGSGE